MNPRLRSKKIPTGRRWLCVFLALVALLRQNRAFANPTGMGVVSGSATAQQLGSQLNITVSQAAILNWQSFNIGVGETTAFLQPSANSVVLNVIGGANPSQIFGSLKANGTVILENANGFYFGPNSFVKVGGSFIATTAPLTSDFGAGAGWQFNGPPPLASIVNYGKIEAGAGRSLFLIAENIENHGNLNAPGGSVDLVAGQSVLVSDSPDGRGLSAAVTLPQGSVDNFGRITADGGSIMMQARVVNQDGLLQANSVQNKNGVIELVASDQLNLGANSQIAARGDDSTSGSAGGTVTLKSENIFNDADGSQIITTGGEHGGNGGNIEVSAPNIESLNSSMDASAQTGYFGGVFFLDPANIVLGTSGSGTVPANGTVAYNSGGTLSLNVNSAFANITVGQILLQATGNIYVGNGTVNNSTGAFTFSANPGITWNLSATTPAAITSGLLALEAGGDIIFGNKSTITDAKDWSVSLYAGYNFNSGMVNPGIGNIYLNGGLNANKSLQSLKGSIQTAQGSITLDAGNGIYLGTGSVQSGSGGIQATALGSDINLQAGFFQSSSGDIDLTAQNNISTSSGYIVTTGGGNISASALSGDIVVGTKISGVQNSGYEDDVSGNWNVSATLGGISTMAGGNVTLDAANGSINPSTKLTTFGISGAFGSEPGNVTLIAGNQISGTFNVANGTGTILAGVNVAGNNPPTILNSSANVGSQSQPVSLQLASGSWNVFAGDNIYLGEVRNPAGTFDSGDSFPFNYSPTAAANFWAGNGITLLGQNLPRTDNNSTMPAIYAPQLRLNAGAGGITVDSAIVLAPSKAGLLDITTSAGGDLIAVDTDISNPSGITMSDSGSADWTTFVSDHASTPLHLNDPNPVTLDIAGNIYGFILNIPTFANITVAGSTYNFGFSGQNLSPSQTTFINVTGDILYADALHAASVALTDPLPVELLSQTLSGDPDVAKELTYAGGKLSINSQMTLDGLNFLLNPTVAQLDSNGKPVLDSSGNPVLIPVTLDATQRGAVLALYAESQAQNGLALSGSGNFNITARSMSLGVSDGITVDFPNAPDAALTGISTAGANINVTTSGDLDLTATKIADGGLSGGINLSIGGKLDVGGTATTLGDPHSPKGIFTTSGGSITVNVTGDVNVDGSRIAAYNGGDINITSQNGDVNAGAGGEGFVIFQTLQLDPVTGQLIAIPTDIPLSGILATTVFGSDAELGDITINTPNGSVNSSLGGVLQIAFNNANTVNNFINVTAGKDINATGSGIIGYNVKLEAGGNINGVVVGSQSVAVTSQQSVNVTAVSGGNVNISAAGTVSGTVIGGGDVSVSGSSIDAAVRGGSVSTSGDASGATLGVPSAGLSQSVQVADNAASVGSKTDVDDDELKKKKGIALAQKVSRVTVLLPEKSAKH